MTKHKSTKRISNRKTSLKNKKGSKKNTQKKSTKKRSSKEKSTKKRSTKKKKSIKKDTKKKNTKKRSSKKKKLSSKKKKDNEDEDENENHSDNHCGFKKMTNLMVDTKVELLRDMDQATRKEIMKGELKIAEEMDIEKKKEMVEKFNRAYKHTKCQKWVILTIYLNLYEYHSACSEFTNLILDIYIKHGIVKEILQKVAEYSKKKDEFILYGLIKEKLKKTTNGNNLSVFEEKKPEPKEEKAPESITQSGGSIEQEIDNILGGNQYKESISNEPIAVIGEITGGKENQVVINELHRTSEMQKAGFDDVLEKLENNKIDTVVQQHYGGSIDTFSSNESTGIVGSSDSDLSVIPFSLRESEPMLGGGSIESMSTINGGVEVEPTDEEYYTEKVKTIYDEHKNKSYDTLERKEDELSTEEMEEFINKLVEWDREKNSIIPVLREYWRTLKKHKIQDLIINNERIYPR